MLNKKFISVIALALAFSMLAGCNKAAVESEVAEHNDLIESVVSEIEEANATTETTAEESEETEETEETAEVAENSEDAMWREFIRSQEDTGALYGFSYSGELYINEDGVITRYSIVDGEIVAEEVPEALYEQAEHYPLLSRNDILRCPIFSDLWTPGAIAFEDNLADGTYYGSVIGVSADGTQLFALIGEPVVITDELLDMQDPDSQILDYNGIPVDLAFGGFYERCGDIRHPEDVSYELTGDSDVHYIVNARLVIIPIADDAIVTDAVSVFFGDGLFNPEDYGDTTFTQSDAWGLTIGAIGSPTSTVNGWYVSHFIIEPMVVTDGQITEIYFGLR